MRTINRIIRVKIVDEQTTKLRSKFLVEVEVTADTDLDTCKKGDRLLVNEIPETLKEVIDNETHYYIPYGRVIAIK